MRTIPALGALVLAVSAAPAQGFGTTSPLSLRDAAGHLTRLFPAPAKATTVVFFTATGCPISNSYAPTYNALAKKYADRGVRFFAVNASGDEASAIAAHAAEYELAFPVLLDAEQRAVRMLGAKVTPEAFVVDDAGHIRYGGRIDDRWGSRVAKREAASSHDLDDAIRAVLAHKVLPVRRTKAFGCAIAQRQAEPVVKTGLTYHRDIEPILQQNCQECHRQDQVAPFELMTYEDVASWGEEIVEFTRAGLMPPWKDTGPRGRFHGDRRLPDADKTKLAEWVRGGMPKGDAAAAPKPAKFRDGWRLGEPDLILEMPGDYTVAASGRDEFVCFPLETGLSEDVYVRAIDCQAGNPRVVHHMVGFLDPERRGRKLDARDAKPGYRSFGGPGFQSAGLFGVWAPGHQANFLPDGVARHLKAGSDIVLQLHYYKTGKIEKDRSRIGLYFAKKPVTHHLNSFLAANFRLRIPAGEKNHVVKSSQKLPFDITLVELFPHMHLLGRKMRLWAELPGGKKPLDLVKVDDWDFNWQLAYLCVEPITLPKDTVLHLEASYDNSADNPRNPSSPPRTVRWGEKTVDEMCIILMDVTTPHKPKMSARELQIAQWRSMMSNRGRRRR